MNKWNGIGNVVRDAELKNINGKDLLAFTVACNEQYKDKSSGELKKGDSLFLDCSLWEGQASAFHPHYVKGTRIYVEGTLRTETWEDKVNGGNRSKIACKVFHTHLVQKIAKDEGQGDFEYGANARPPKREPQPARALGDDLPGI